VDQDRYARLQGSRVRGRIGNAVPFIITISRRRGGGLTRESLFLIVVLVVGEEEEPAGGIRRRRGNAVSSY